MRRAPIEASALVAAVLALASGCGIVLGVEAIEKQALATHDGEGIESLVLRNQVDTDLYVDGGEVSFRGIMKTVEWRPPGRADAPARSAIRFEESGDALEVETDGGGEAVTLRSIEITAPSRVNLSAIVGAGHLHVSKFSADVELDNFGPIEATQMSGFLSIRSTSRVLVESSGEVDVVTIGALTAELSGMGAVSAATLDVELTGPLAGPLSIEASGESGALVYVRPDVGVVLEMTSGSGLISVLVGDTDLQVSEEFARQTIEIGGGGPTVSIHSATGSIVIKDSAARGQAPAP